MKLPWMSLPSTVANLHSFGLECVKQFFNDDCRRWIQQKRAKLMQNLMRNDEKCQKSFGEFGENWREILLDLKM
jgi:hypothetical protein